MCGFSGEVNFSQRPACIETVHEMTNKMTARGPDALGLMSHQNVAFGHRRLKVIDLSDRARQPLHDPALGITVAFNGCIYNHHELRRELEALGYRFFSAGDTEVIAKAFHAWGTACVTRFQGMFAFAVHDLESGRIVLARDRLGIKPLYIAHDAGRQRLLFASSLPALLAAQDIDTSLDPVALQFYLTFHSVVPAPFTIVNGVRKVPPATVVEFDADGHRTDRPYWDLNFERSAEDVSRSDGEWQELTTQVLETAVRRRMIADVPVGVLLSGGLDSSLIVGLLARSGQHGLNTFSIGFDAVDEEDGDEFEYSDHVAAHFATEHHKLYIDSQRVFDALPRAISAMSEPMVSHDNVAFCLLAEHVRQHVKVVQSGQGADEVFAGYHWYPALNQTDDALQTYAEVFFDRDYDDLCLLLRDRYLVEDYARPFVSGHFSLPGAGSSIDKALRMDTLVMLVDDPVKRIDNMTMASGIEARVPFLDHELVELSARMPARLKLDQGGKGILKSIARGLIPDTVIDRSKGYFPVPALKYPKGPYLELLGDVLHSRAARERSLFRPDYVETLLRDPKKHLTPLGGSKLWQIGLLELWLQAHAI